jgi:hypothetical protein
VVYDLFFQKIIDVYCTLNSKLRHEIIGSFKIFVCLVMLELCLDMLEILWNLDVGDNVNAAVKFGGMRMGKAKKLSQ